MRLPRDSVLAKVKATKDLPPIEVVWKDHCSSDAWASLETHRKRLTPSEVTSIGRLFGNKRTYIQIAQSVTECGDAFNTLTIIKSCIVRVSRAEVRRG